MAFPLNNSSEGGDGFSVLTTDNTGGLSFDRFDTVFITAPMNLIFDARHPSHGVGGVRLMQPGAATSICYVEWGSTSIGAPVTQIWGRLYFWCPVIPNSTLRLLRFAQGATQQCMLGLTSGTNNVEWRDSAGNAIAGQTGVALGTSTLIRCEFTVTFGGAGASSATAKVYSGDSLNTLGADAVVTAQNFGTGCDKVQFGATTANFHNVATDLWMDDFNLNITGFPGPGPFVKTDWRGAYQ